MHLPARLFVAATLPLAGFLASFSALAYDADFSLTPAVTQADFRSISEDMGSAYSYKPLTPAEPMGITGFDIGAIAVFTETENPEAWQRATTERVEAIGGIGLSVNKGLPFGFNVGASALSIPGTDVYFLGANGSYALVKGGAVTPAVALRASYTVLNGVDDFDFQSYGADLSISKGFTVLTPYAGAGIIRVESTPNSSFTQNQLNATLQEEAFNLNKLFLGLRMNFLAFRINLEADKTGDANSFNVKAAFGF